jgi:hypothetical protein
MTRPAIPALIVAAAVLAGCSSSNGVSTAAILESAPTPPPAGAAAPMAPTSTPTDRAFQVGSVSARATKCGYNFDAARLKAAYMANEMGRGTDTSQLDKVYQVAYNGVMKAAVEDPNYCSERKTQTIKADLNRLLAGDFEPPKKAVVAEKQEDGFFSGWFDGSSNESGPSFGSDDWWQSQADKVSK